MLARHRRDILKKIGLSDAKISERMAPAEGDTTNAELVANNIARQKQMMRDSGILR